MPADLAFEIADSKFYTVFEEFCGSISPTVVARILHVIPKELKRDGFNVEVLREDHFRKVLELIRDGKIAKEGAEEVLKLLIEKPELNKEEIARALESKIDVDSFIEKLVESKIDLIKEKGDLAFKPLMGIVMAQLRGKIDGKIVAEKLKIAIKKYIKNN